MHLVHFFLSVATAFADPFIDGLLAPYAGNSPGASLGIYRSGELVVEKSVGLAHYENGVAATSVTNYRLASLTKAFTALSVLLLADEGKLSLENSLTDFFPDFPAYGKKISVYHLIHHQSGLLDYEDLIPATQTEQLKDVGVLALLKRESITYFEPGSRYRYSNSGYALLSLIVEKVSGIGFANFLAERVFAPLGMGATVAYEKGISEISNRAFGYTKVVEGFEQTDQSLTSAVLGDGGIYSSIEDFAIWNRFLDLPWLLSPTARPQLFQPGILSDESVTTYAAGWQVDTYRGLRRQSHTGSTIGFRSAIQRFPDQDFSIVIFINRADSQPWEIARQVADHYLFSAPLERAAPSMTTTSPLYRAGRRRLQHEPMPKPRPHGARCARRPPESAWR